MNGKASLVFALLLLFCSAASAALLVDISPKDPGKQLLSLYLNESGDYGLDILNQAAFEARDVVVRVSASEGLKVVDSGVEKSAVSFVVDSIPANAKQSFLVRVKPVESSTKSLFLYVDYGIGEFTHLAATSVLVAESPLLVEAGLSGTALDVGGEGSVSLSLRNVGSEPVSSIRAELLVFPGLESLDGVVELASLAPGEGYEANPFPFRADPAAAGEIPLVMQVSFEDSLGRHVIEEGFSVEIQSRQTVIYLIVAIIILLVMVAFVSGKRLPKQLKKLEKPIVQEIEGKKVKKP